MATVTTTFTTINGLLVHEDRGGVETEYVSDPLGSLVQTRNSSGTKTYEAEYWPYGELQASTGTNPSPWGYVGLLGYFSDSATVLYVRARYLMQKFGRWLTRDPFWPILPKYIYVNNSPVNGTDASGLEFGVDDELLLWLFLCMVFGGIGSGTGKTGSEVCEQCLDGLIGLIGGIGGGAAGERIGKGIGQRMGGSGRSQGRTGAGWGAGIGGGVGGGVSWGWMHDLCKPYKTEPKACPPPWPGYEGEGGHPHRQGNGNERWS